MLQFFNNFDNFSAEFDLLFIFEFVSHDPPKEQLLSDIYIVSYVVKKVLIVDVLIQVTSAWSFTEQRKHSFEVMAIFWSHILEFFFLIIFREERVIHVFILPFHIWHIFMSLYLQKECIALIVKVKFCYCNLWFYFLLVFFFRSRGKWCG